jgi:hypothetical protein
MLWRVPTSQCPRLLGCSCEYLKLAVLFGNYSKPERWLQVGNKNLNNVITSRELTQIMKRKP